MALHEEMLRRGLESPYEKIFEERANRAQERGDEWRELEITTRVPCGDYFEVRDQALKAHATQVDPNGFWFSCPLEVQRSAWPTEDYHLARSVVDSGLPERRPVRGYPGGGEPLAHACSRPSPRPPQQQRRSPGVLGSLMVAAMGVALSSCSGR